MGIFSWVYFVSHVYSFFCSCLDGMPCLWPHGRYDA